ncbi:MAG TPA: type II toxin-antitoxin system prevent-host-death family antitoxin [Candidatus Binatia bacterium]|nr:type II toxin-antitoxin system prevent-host-death family antitoxin [Candidatus Binatia bacterium]
MRTTAAVAELKAQLSRYLSRVKAGDEVLVTERGLPIARLVPVEASDSPDDSLADLERQGLARRGSGKLPRNFWQLPRPRDAKASLRKAVAEEREAGW